MKLTDLDPRWLMDGDRKAGFAFKSPVDPQWWQTCFFEAGRNFMRCNDPNCDKRQKWHCGHSQLGLCKAAGVDTDYVQGCRTDFGWTPHGDLDFETLTITPSIDGSAGGLWHGHITNGEVR